MGLSNIPTARTGIKGMKPGQTPGAPRYLVGAEEI